VLNFQLFADGTLLKSGSRAAGTSTPRPRLYVEMYGPGETLPGNPDVASLEANQYANVLLEPDSTYALSFDANQYSQTDIETLTEELRSQIAANGPDNAYEELVQLAAADFLFEKNRSLREVADLTSTDYRLDYGFTVAQTSRVQMDTLQPEIDIRLSPFGTYPTSFSINEIRTTGAFVDLSNSTVPEEASQLANWQTSFDQSNTHEKLLGVDGVSTLRYVQRAFAGQSLWRSNGPLSITSPSNPSFLRVLETRINNGYAELYWLGDLKASFSNPAIPIFNAYDGSFSSLLWQSTEPLDSIDDIEIADEQAALLTAVMDIVEAEVIHTTGVNMTIRDELAAYLESSLTLNGGSGTLSKTRVIFPVVNISIGTEIGGAFFGNRPESGYGTRLIDRFGDDEVTGAETDLGAGVLTSEIAGNLTTTNAFFTDWYALPEAFSSGASGNTTTQATDISFPNIGVPLDFNRSYSSRYELSINPFNSNEDSILRDVGLGLGWTHRFSDRIIINRHIDGFPELIWSRSTGQEHRFFYNSAQGKYNVPAELLGTFNALGPASFPTGYEYLDRDGTRYEFELTGESIFTAGSLFARLSSVVDRNQNGFQVTYDAGTIDRIASVEDINTPGRRLEFDYLKQDSADEDSYRISEIRKYSDGSLVGTWEYQYVGIEEPGTTNTNWYLKRVTSPADGNLIAADEIKILYDYYDSADPDVFSGLLKRITSPNQNYREFDYYLNRRKLRENFSANPTGQGFETTSRSYSYNLVTNTTEMTDERGNVTTTAYQSNGLQLRQINSDRTRQENTWGAINSPEVYLIQSSTDEVGAIETFVYYTGSGFKERQLQESTSKRFFMSDGMTLVAGTQPGIVTQYDYRRGTGADQQHIVDTKTVTVDPGNANFVTTYDYYPGTDLQKSISNSLGDKTEFVYFSDGTFKDGLVSSQKRPKTGGTDFETLYDYDKAGNLITASTDGLLLSTTEYDHNGQPTQVTDGEGVIFDSLYDILGRLRSSSVGDGANGSLPEFTNSFEYDSNAQILSATDRNGNTTSSTYDLRGNIVTRTNPDGSIVQFEFDEASNLISLTDELGRITSFVYDSRNRPIQTIYPDGAIERTRYDGVGRVAAIVDGRGNKTSFTYGADGRLLTTVNANPITAENTTTNEYDDIGRLVWSQDFNGNYTLFEYDDLGRVVETRTLDEAESDPESPTRNPKFVSTTEYDKNGNVFRTAVYDVDLLLTPISSGGAGLASFPADPKTLLTPTYLNNAQPFLQVTETIYDSLDRPTETVYVGASADGSGANVSVRTEYDSAGRVEFTYDELNRKTEFIYDAYGRLARTILPDPDAPSSGQDSPEITRIYDAAGNLTSTTDANGNTTSSEYDVFNRLVATTDAEGNKTSLVYDLAGQLVASIDALGRAVYSTYDDRGRVRLERTTDPDGAGPLSVAQTTYTYDEAGNVKGVTTPNGYQTTSMVDELNRLVTEFTTDVQIADIVAHDSDPYFDVEFGTPTSTGNFDASFGKDHTDIVGTATKAPQATWTFDNLTAGTYRIALTWQADSSLDSGAMARIYVNGIERETATAVPQDTFPTDFALDYQGKWLSWQALRAGFSLNQGDDLKITLVGSAAGSSTKIRADAVMLDREVSRSYVYDGNGNLTVTTGTLGRQTSNTYDSRNLLKSTTLPDPDEGGGLAAPVVEQVYDGYGNVLETIERRGTAADRTQKLAYDKRNRLVESVTNYQDGNYNTNLSVDQDLITKNVYDDVGNLKQMTTAAGSPEETANAFEYDDLDRLTVETIDIAISGGSSNSRTPYDHRNEYQYDPGGNLIRTESFVNDPNDADEASIVTTFEFDDIDRLIKQVDDAGVQTYNINATSRFVYDAVGNVIQEIDPTGRVTTREYDRLNRVVKSTSPGAEQSAPTMEYVYDVLGNVARATNGEGETTESIYDSLGREISQFDANGDETRYRYDAFGNLLSVIDAVQNITDFQYDKLDRLKTATIYDNNSLPLTRTYIYNDALNLSQYIDRNGRGVAYTYDALDRITNEKWYATAAFSGSDVGTLEWDYDAAGRITRSESDIPGLPNAPGHPYEETWEYDNLGRVTKRRNYQGGSNENPRFEQRYTYDLVNNSSNTSPFESTTTQLLESQTLAKTTYSSDRLGRVVTIVDEDQSGTPHSVPTKMVEYTYDAAGRMFSTGRTASSFAGFAFDTNYIYDGTGRLDNLLHFRNNESSPFLSYGYSYDTASRITALDRNFDTTNVAAFSALAANRSEAFEFDLAGQLTQRNASDTAGIEDSFTYDENGNRTLANGATYTTDANNRVTFDGTYSYTYDGEGNLTEKYLDANASGTWNSTEVGKEFKWDHRNRLVQVIDRLGNGTLVQQTSYGYNNENLRVRKVVQTGPVPGISITDVEHFVYDGSQVVVVLAGAASGNTVLPTGTLANRYLNGPGTDQLLVDAVYSGNTANLRWAVADHLGSVGQLLNNSGQVVEHREFDSFGNISALFDSTGVLKQSGGEPDLNALDSVFAFAGREWDNDADLYYNRARWLDANLGRFISVDPLGFDAGDANLYRYAGNDPLNRFDPSGQSWLSSIFKKVGREIGRVVEDIGNFIIDTAEFIGDSISSTLDTFEYIVKNPEDAFKTLVNDPLFWGSLALGTIFTASFSWGFFDLNLGVGGLNFGPNLLDLGRQGFSALTGGGFNVGLPTFNLKTPFFSLAGNLDVGALQSYSNVQQVDFIFDPSTGRQIFTGFAVVSDYDNAAGLYDVGNYDYSDLGLGSSGQPIFISNSPIASSLLSSEVSSVASTPLQGAVVGAANVGQAFWKPFRWLGLTNLVGIEDTLQQRDAWLANQQSQIFLRDSLTGAIAEGSANLAAEAAYAVGGETLFAKALTWGKGLFSGAKAAKASLITSGRANHILVGDATGGGHKFGLGRLFNGKTKFPWKWSDDKILNAVSDVATNPSSKWIQQTGKPGSLLTKAGNAVKFKVEGVFDGVKIRAIVQGGEVITGFPIP